MSGSRRGGLLSVLPAEVYGRTGTINSQERNFKVELFV